MTKKTWQKIWASNQYSTVEKTLSLRALIDLNAFYSISTESWQNYVLGILKKTGKTNTDLSILEIGCGSGALLKVLEPFSSQLTGVDYSAKQIATCRLALPNGSFSIGEAKDIDFAAQSFDLILSNSVFQYFPDLAYTKEVLNKMLACLKNGGVGVVLDLADIEYKDAYLAWKKRELGEKTLATSHPTQMYFSTLFFKEFAEKNTLKFQIEKQNISGYNNTEYRFNFFFWK